MLERETDPNVYDETVTARIYNMLRPDMVIVNDTGQTEYHELYKGQRNCIKSSLVYPVLSSGNELLETLVCHCDKPNFFASQQEKSWKDLMEVFAIRVAHEVIIIRCQRIVREEKYQIDYESSEFAPY